MIFFRDNSCGVGLPLIEFDDDIKLLPLPPINFGITNFDRFCASGGKLIFCDSAWHGFVSAVLADDDKCAFANSDKLLNFVEPIKPFGIVLVDFCPKILGNLNLFACKAFVELRCFNKSVSDNGFESYLCQNVKNEHAKRMGTGRKGDSGKRHATKS